MKKHLKNKKILLAVALVLVLALLAKAQTKNNQPVSETSQPSARQPSALPTNIPVPNDYSLEIGPQASGTTIILDKVDMPKEGWLVLYSDDKGKIGEVIEEASPSIAQGTSEKTVLLLRNPLVKGQKYFALIQDTPDGQPIKNSKGEVVSKEFIVK